MHLLVKYVIDETPRGHLKVVICLVLLVSIKLE